MKLFCLKGLRLQLLVILFAFCWAARRTEAQHEAPMIVGTWKLNVAKSKFESGPALRSRTLTWKWDGETLHHTADSVNADGSRTSAHFSARFDGKDYPVFANGNDKEPARYVRLKWIDAYNFEAVGKSKEGKESAPLRHVIAKDGKTETITQKSPQGTDVLFYEKQ